MPGRVLALFLREKSSDIVGLGHPGEVGRPFWARQLALGLRRPWGQGQAGFLQVPAISSSGPGHVSRPHTYLERWLPNTQGNPPDRGDDMREGRWSEVASRGHTLTWMRLLESEQEHIAGEGRGRLPLTDAIFYKRSQEVFWPEDGSASWESGNTSQRCQAVPGRRPVPRPAAWTRAPRRALQPRV